MIKFYVEFSEDKDILNERIDIVGVRLNTTQKFVECKDPLTP